MVYTFSPPEKSNSNAGGTNWRSGNFADVTANELKTFRRHGLRDIIMILHNWQRFGYDTKLPDHIPPNPLYGGESAIRSMLATAAGLGYRVALHENYTDNYPDAPSYSAANNSLNSDGSYTNAWFNGQTGVQSYSTKPTAGPALMRNVAPQLAGYGVTAGFVDVISSMDFGAKVDHDSSVEGACLGRTQIEKYIEMMDYAREVYKGPFLGEGAWNYLYTGAADAVEPALTQLASWDERPWCKFPPVVDYDLVRIHGRMVNHGPGYFQRFFGGGTYDAQSPDTARAHTIAFGRAGFIDTSWNRYVFDLPKAFRDYYTMHPVQHFLTTANATEIRYEKNGHYRPLTQALSENDAWRVRVIWDSGATVWVNGGQTSWMVSPGNGNTYSLAPSNGWLVFKDGSDGILAYSTRRDDGTRIDYTETKNLAYQYVGAPLETGGSVSIAHPEWGNPRDIHSVATRSVAPQGTSLLTSSYPGSSNLEWSSSTRAVFVFSDSGAAYADIVYKDAPQHWRLRNSSIDTEHVRIWEITEDGTRLRQVAYNLADGVQSLTWRATKNTLYELTGPAPLDSDADGLLDEWEVADLDSVTPGTQNPFSLSDADVTGDGFSVGPDGIPDGRNDWDGDGVGNALEFTFGYNPVSPDSVPQLPASSVADLWILIAAIAAGGLFSLLLGGELGSSPETKGLS